MNLFRFLPHFQGSSVGNETVPKKHQALVSGKEWDEGSFGVSDEVKTPRPHVLIVS